MSRGGRGRGGGGRKGPDFSYDDSAPAPQTNKPAPTFPDVPLPTPRPLEDFEVDSVKAYLSHRKQIRKGPFYALLDPSSFTDDKGKVDNRAGFDPFNDQETYSSKSQLKKRTLPDFSNQPTNLQFFPKELWHTIDPKRRHPLWKTVEEPLLGARSRKRKRPLAADTQNEDDQNSDDDSDVVVTGRRKHNAARSRKTDPTTKPAKQKEGLDAEDDYPDAADANEDEEGDIDDDIRDSEFEESEDDVDDYNAQKHFEEGEDDDMGMDGGGDDGDVY
jgi:DNA-directed RNA polymerase III subunit RPC7